MMTRTGLALLATLVLAACGGDNTGPDGDGNGNGDGNGATSSKVTISGGASATFEGPAGFAAMSDVEDEMSAFVIAGGEDDETASNDGAFMLIKENTSRPGTGTYTIGGEDNENPAVWSATVVTDNLLIGAESGEVRITSSSDERIKGTFSFTGTGYDLTDDMAEVTVSVSGTFDALGDEDVVVMKRTKVELHRAAAK